MCVDGSGGRALTTYMHGPKDRQARIFTQAASNSSVKYPNPREDAVSINNTWCICQKRGQVCKTHGATVHGVWKKTHTCLDMWCMGAALTDCILHSMRCCQQLTVSIRTHTYCYTCTDCWHLAPMVDTICPITDGRCKKAVASCARDPDQTLHLQPVMLIRC